jgi:hypothetical protein
MTERVRKLGFQRPHSLSPELTRFADAIEGYMRQAIPQWAQGSVLIADIEFTAGIVKQIPHNLGRTHKGWLMVAPSDAGVELSEATGHASFRSALASTHLQLLPIRRIDHTENINFPSIAAGAANEQTFTVSGARAGDAVLASPTSALATGIAFVHARVTASNTVGIRLTNFSGGPIDPAAQDWHVTVFERNGGTTFKASIVAW